MGEDRCSRGDGMDLLKQLLLILEHDHLIVAVHGKGGHGVKSSAAKPGLQERKPLRDLSNANKPLAPSARNTSALKERTFVKEKSIARVRETIKNVPKSNLLTDEDIKKCHEWAKEGVERAHFTGNDLQKLQKDQQEQRVRKEVEEVVSALHEWNRAFDFGMPKKVLPRLFLRDQRQLPKELRCYQRP